MRRVTLYAALCAAVLVLAGSAHADIIAGYDSGVAAAPGNAGAADPQTQGWLANIGGSVWTQGYDSGDGGWRTVDATSSACAYYQYDLSTVRAPSALV